jgi:hypothetical protein
MDRTSFIVYFKSTASVRDAEKVVVRLNRQRGIAYSGQLANQHGGVVWEFQVSDSWSDSFQDAVRGEKLVREFGRSDRKED